MLVADEKSFLLKAGPQFAELITRYILADSDLCDLGEVQLDGVSHCHYMSLDKVQWRTGALAVALQGRC